MWVLKINGENKVEPKTKSLAGNERHTFHVHVAEV